MASRPAVALVECDDYAPEHVEAALRRAVDLLGGLGRYVRPGMRVALKPNLLRAMPPEAATTTHPSVVRAVVRLVQECGATAVIADSPGGPFTPALLRRLYEKTGMRQVAEETGAELNYDTAVARVPNPEGGLLRLVEVIAAVAGADVVINLPKLKTHNLTRLTVATKNLFGVIPGVTKLGYHAKLQDALAFSQGLIDILRCVRPVLSIVDGIVAMDGNGPSGGDPFDGRVLLAGADAVAVDVVAMALVGWEPLTMPAIKVAVEWGLATGRVEDIELLGDPLEGLRFAGFRPGSATTVDPGLLPHGLQRLLLPLIEAHAVDGRRAGSGEVAAESLDVGTVPAGIRRWATRQLVVAPQAGARCTGCGYCAEHCPVAAIVVNGRRAHMDPKRCIRCYCCHELCPQLAVELHRPWLGRLFFGQ
ncbi:MAG TPA: DUF362 domain-containing protein [Anaerolineae bacterium]|nr:DUF362 domain-containing protein [Anaerolineae bacterium]HOQ98089.1 DUF362 domain-containing protein [Anaerolineae bacterium]HPL29136.1 DUF362 domain-containing protein [Anaerolineae bacterium]